MVPRFSVSPDDLEFAGLLAFLVALVIDLAAGEDVDLHEAGEGVDYADADAVQAAGDLVRSVVELSARVQLGHDDFDGGTFSVLWTPTGMPRPLSSTLTSVVRVNGHADRVAIASHGLVDAVVPRSRIRGGEDLPHPRFRCTWRAVSGPAPGLPGPGCFLRCMCFPFPFIFIFS